MNFRGDRADLLILDLGDIGGLKAFQQKVLPVDLLEEAMVFDITNSVLEVAVAF